MGGNKPITAGPGPCLCPRSAPASVTCCGFGGDRGFQVPELNASALQDLRDEVQGCSAGYSNNRTCEIGLGEHSGLQYQSILYLVDRVSRPLEA